jgi:glycosyltransferase involved in cell wall biosynthesis
MNEPLVSIIVSFYNEEQCLPRCLNSVKNQNYQALELILIDDGSTDFSLDVATKFATEFQVCKVVSITNSGLSEARNYGLSIATGSYVTFLDADDEFKPNMIDVCLSHMQDRSVDIAICRFSILDSKGGAEIVSGWKEEMAPINDTKDLISQLYQFGISETVWAKMYRTELAQKISFEKDIWFEDRPYLLEYLFNAQKVSFIEESLLNIYKREGSITRRTIEPKRIIDTEKVFELEIGIAKKYSLDFRKLEVIIVRHYLSILIDNYLIQIADFNKIVDAESLRNTFAYSVSKFKTYIKERKIKLGVKNMLKLQLLGLNLILGWSISNFMIRTIMKRRFEQILKLK